MQLYSSEFKSFYPTSKAASTRDLVLWSLLKALDQRYVFVMSCVLTCKLSTLPSNLALPSPQCPYYSRRQLITKPPVHLPDRFSTTNEQVPELLKSTRNRREQSIFLWQEIMASGLVVLKFIPTALYSIARCLGVHQKSEDDETYRATSSAKKRDLILKSPVPTFFTTP